MTEKQTHYQRCALYRLLNYQQQATRCSRKYPMKNLSSSKGGNKAAHKKVFHLTRSDIFFDGYFFVLLHLSKNKGALAKAIFILIRVLEFGVNAPHLIWKE
jgi:hypothetical protein